MGISGGVRLSVLALLGLLATFSFAKADDDFQTRYADLVQSENFKGALALVCSTYRLGCNRARIKITKNDQAEAYAHTGVDQTIHLYPAAFHHPSSPVPHPGWLGAIVAHELIHRSQGSFGRIYSQLERIYGRNNYYVAARELEAWQYMMDNARGFRLNCAMYVEIEFSREYYEWIVQHKGKLPPGDSVPSNASKFQKLQNKCREWNAS